MNNKYVIIISEIILIILLFFYRIIYSNLNFLLIALTISNLILTSILTFRHLRSLISEKPKKIFHLKIYNIISILTVSYFFSKLMFFNFNICAILYNILILIIFFEVITVAITKDYSK
jgi:hypothetical protein